MAVTHHPTSDWLLSYASGQMSSAHALATAAHLSACAQCRLQLSSLNNVGGSLLEQLPPAALASDSWQKLSRRLTDQQAPQSAVAAAPASAAPASLPAPVRALLPEGLPRKWTRLGTRLKQATLKELPDGTLVALHYIRAGGQVPQHTHDGIEITLVLNGSFSDQHGLYQSGDMLVLDEHTDHTPTAVQNEDCLCLTVQSAPIRLTGPIGRWFNPLVRALS